MEREYTFNELLEIIKLCKNEHSTANVFLNSVNLIIQGAEKLEETDQIWVLTIVGYPCEFHLNKNEDLVLKVSNDFVSVGNKREIKE